MPASSHANDMQRIIFTDILTTWISWDISIALFYTGITAGFRDTHDGSFPQEYATPSKEKRNIIWFSAEGIDAY